MNDQPAAPDCDTPVGADERVRGAFRIGGLSWRRRAFWVAFITVFVQLVGMYGPGSGGY